MFFVKLLCGAFPFITRKVVKLVLHIYILVPCKRTLFEISDAVKGKVFPLRARFGPEDG